MTLIKCNDLSVGYGGIPVAEQISFSLSEGDFLCIIGANGSGKSTLIKTLTGLCKPVSGSIQLAQGLDRAGIGYLPQQTPVQKDFPASVFEVVLSGCLNSCGILPFYTRSQKALARKNLEALQISHLERCCYRSLSGGQQQRVLLARALCASSRLIVLDEPVTGLDNESVAEMYAAIHSLRQKGCAVIMVSHDAADALSQVTHVLHLSQRPRFFGTVKDYIESDVGRAYLSGGGKK